jgi:isopenicillin N synthase-like dioxygenase
MTMAAAYHDDAPAANLEIIDLSHLLLSDPTEQQKLCHACVSTGFFYLGLSGHSSLESDWQKLLDFSHEYFALPEDEKIKDARSSDIYG